MLVVKQIVDVFFFSSENTKREREREKEKKSIVTFTNRIKKRKLKHILQMRRSQSAKNPANKPSSECTEDFLGLK